MQRRIIALLIVVMAVGTTMFITSGCERAKAAGKLQIMYSGNIRGNVSPCG